MQESSTYQAILQEGRIEGRIQGAIAEAKKLLRRLGDEAFGPPNARTAKTIERQNDLRYLEALLRYVRTADSWDGLLIWVLIKESSTYQAILEEGRVEGENQGAIAEVKRMLRRFGDEAFGPPDACTAAAIERLEDLPRLEDLFLRLRTANSWRELLGQPAPGRRDRRRRTS